MTLDIDKNSVGCVGRKKWLQKWLKTVVKLEPIMMVSAVILLRVGPLVGCDGEERL